LKLGDRTILNNIYLQTKTGEVTGVLGRNGCGKSCLLKLIFGEIQTNEKSVRINGETLYEDNRNPDDMKMLPQFNFLPKHIKVIQAFKFFDLDFAEFCSLFSEFSEWPRFRIKELSGGNVRIIETYLIVKSKTKFCLLDEPFTHLSPQNARTFMDIINQEKDNKGFIITDQMYEYITEISDSLYLIKEGVSYKIEAIDKLREHGYLR